MSKLWFEICTISALLVTGCNSNVEHWEDHERIVEVVDIDGDFSIYCDKTTNMAYLFYISGHRSAITAYLNADGNPARCNEVRR